MLKRYEEIARETVAAGRKEAIAVIDGQLAASGRLVDELRVMRARIAGENPGPAYHSPEHLAAALTWIEQNEPNGIALVARALAATGK